MHDNDGSTAAQALQVTQNLILLERGEEELLLADSVNLRPLYVRRGKEYIKGFLDKVRELSDSAKIEEAFPNDVSLLHLLMEHSIVVASGRSHLLEDKCECECNCGKPPDNLAEAARKHRDAISLYLLLSQSCNLGCIYCLNGKDTYKTSSNLKMTEEIAFKSVERCLDSLTEDGSLEIVFFGGEPLLNWPLAKQIILHCENVLQQQYPGKSIRYHLTSNLAILPPDLIEWAQKYSITFLCDIDGPQAIHDICRPFRAGAPSHACITANIKRLIDAGLKVALRTTVTRHNQDCLVEIAQHHKDLGGSGSAFVPVNPVNSDQDILSESLLPSVEKLTHGLAEIYRSRIWDKEDLFPFNVYVSHVYSGARNVMGCGAPYGNTPVVDVNGDVYPCIYLVGIKRFFMGNIMSEQYPENDILDWMMDYLNVDHLEQCKPCEWRYLCGGGCPVGRLTIHENPGASAEVTRYCDGITCDYTKQVLQLLLWDMAEEAAVAEKLGPDEKRSDHIPARC